MAFLSIMARFGMDATGFKAGIKQVESASKGLSRDLNGNLKGAIAGAFGTAAIVAAGKATMDYAGQIADLSERLGVSTDALQEMDFAARLTGTNLETFTGFLEKLSVSREEALQGNDELRDSFARLGVSLEDLRTKRLEDLTRQIGRAVQGGDVQQLMPSLKGVGGRGAGALVPTFRMGLEEAGQQARAANAIISAEDIAALDEAGDQFSALFQIIRAQLAPAMIWLGEAAIDAVYGIRAAAAALGEAFTVFTPANIARIIATSANPFAAAAQIGAQAVDTVGNSEAAGNIMLERDAMRERLRAAAAERQSQFGQGPNGAIATGRAAATQEERLARLREQVAERELRLLPAAAQRAAMEERIAKLRAEIARLTPIAAEDRAAEEALLKAQIDMMNAQDQAKAIAEPSPIAGLQGDPMVNALERIGGSFGTADTGVTQVRKLDGIHNELKSLKQEMKSGNNNTSAIKDALT
jgi:hypothetical protein